MKYLLLFWVLSVSQLQAKTYDFADRFGVGGGGGWTFPIQHNPFDEFAESELMWNLHVRYHTTSFDSLQLNYSHHEFEDTDIDARITDLTYLRRLNQGDKFTPILGIGAGVADMDNIEPFHDGLKFAARARAGFEYALTDDLVTALFVDYQYVGKMPFNSEDEDNKDEAFPGQEIFALTPQLSLTYFFGPDKEIEEPQEKKPTPEAVVPAVDSSLLDDDKDGVINSVDKCPGTEVRQTVNEFGC